MEKIVEESQVLRKVIKKVCKTHKDAETKARLKDLDRKLQKWIKLGSLPRPSEYYIHTILEGINEIKSHLDTLLSAEKGVVAVPRLVARIAHVNGMFPEMEGFVPNEPEASRPSRVHMQCNVL